MATNSSDLFKASEHRAAAAALRQMPSEMALQSAIANAGSPQNMTAPNANPDAGPQKLLRCGTVKISEGVLR